jgi:hypothetical protein
MMPRMIVQQPHYINEIIATSQYIIAHLQVNLNQHISNLVVWDISTGRELARHVFIRAFNLHMAVSSDGRQLAVNMMYQHTQILCLPDLSLITSIQLMRILPAPIIFTNNDTCLWTFGGSNRLLMIDIASHIIIQRYNPVTDNGWDVIYAPDRKQACLIDMDCNLILWHMKQLNPFMTIQLPLTDECCACYSPDSTMLYLNNTRGQVCIFTIATKSIRYIGQPTNDGYLDHIIILSPILTLTIDDNDCLCLWNTTSGHICATKQENEWVHPILVNPGQLMVGQENGNIVIYEP